MLTTRSSLQCPGVEVVGDEQSPLLHVYLKKAPSTDPQAEDAVLRQVAAKVRGRGSEDTLVLNSTSPSQALEKGVALTTAYYVWEEEMKPRRPSLRVVSCGVLVTRLGRQPFPFFSLQTVSSEHCAQDLDAIADGLREALKACDIAA